MKFLVVKLNMLVHQSKLRHKRWRKHTKPTKLTHQKKSSCHVVASTKTKDGCLPELTNANTTAEKGPQNVPTGQKLNALDLKRKEG
jgi:hypothetical protein